MENFDRIKDEVNNAGGVLTLQAWRLRDAVGAGRLTERINASISKELRSRGLGHVPFQVEHLPTYQDQEVRVFDATTSLGRVISAAHEPGADTDALLRESVNGEASNILEQVRILVSEE